MGFTLGNSYIADKRTWTWSLPSGHTCPGARECFAAADRDTGRLTHGKHQTFLCYAAVSERYSGVRKAWWGNYEAVRGKSPGAVADALDEMLDARAKLVRAHVGGDFFSQDYFDGWMELAKRRPNTAFYAFTKSLPYWVARLGHVPDNFVLTASTGGKHDHLIDTHGLRAAVLVRSEEEAARRGLQIDDGDTLARASGPSFALVDRTRRKRTPLTMAF